ncbi:DUF4160 domain-containing protein [Bacteroides helcogenes]|uniref:DUF4160 domain-containing protein n=1 Tax=Bacteroides helcogenes (strain ATCC 35417 / DSM 20613 / JCM 6297 / CCUG 15421 / P 36-108) TaxID=693979 RepID=E6SSV5_BACT6|nr:DUF4160 domain-containing protein [Bacteroides helcogenes]ADV44186.1 hypothetical protein Bache_2217 [Bacteroides helcogenes P 36-108]MDY5238400.1 DUF4160 domain-containing protein [Bacteroides helcogenes]
MNLIFRRKDGYCFKIFSNEEERRHIHVVKADCEAKFWLEPSVELAENYGFTNKDLKKITQILERYGDEFKRRFTEHIGKRIDD